MSVGKQRIDPVLDFLKALAKSPNGRMSRSEAQSRFGSYADTAQEEGLAKEFDDGIDINPPRGYQTPGSIHRRLGYQITDAGRVFVSKVPQNSRAAS